MVNQGMIKPSTSSFKLPSTLVLNKDGLCRMCIDYRDLNKITIKNHNPLPQKDDLMEKLKGVRFLYNLDLRIGYHQVRIKEEDI